MGFWDSFFAKDSFLAGVFKGFKSRPFDASLGTEAAQIFTERGLDLLYKQYELIRKIIDELPEDAGAKHLIWQFPEADITSDDVYQYWRSLSVSDGNYLDADATKAFVDAGCHGRLYGDGYIILGINDGKELDEPVNRNAIASIDWLEVRSCYELYQWSGTAYEKDFYFLIPDTATAIAGQEYQQQIRIHESRVLRFPGRRLRGRALRYNHRYQNDSIILGLYNEFASDRDAFAAASTYLQSHSIFTYRLKDLSTLVAQKNREALSARFSSILTGLSEVHGLIMDADREEAAFVSRNYSGVEPLLSKIEDRLCAVSGMPKSKLFGSSNSSAFSEGGLSDRYTWAASVVEYQNKCWLSNAIKLSDYIFLAKNGPTGGELPNYTIEYPSILQLTDKERAEIRLIDAQVFRQHFEMGTLTSSEIRKTFEGSEYTSEITLDPDVDLSLSPYENPAALPSARELTAIAEDAQDLYYPPKAARENARKALRWRDKYGDKVLGGTSIGWGRATQLASGDGISLDIVKRMAQFNRHRGNSKLAPDLKATPWRDAGYVAWLLWGGDAGINWALRITKKLKDE